MTTISKSNILPTHRRSNTGANFIPAISMKQLHETKVLDMKSREHSSVASQTGRHTTGKDSTVPPISSGPASGTQLSYKPGKVEVLRRDRSQPDGFAQQQLNGS